MRFKLEWTPELDSVSVRRVRTMYSPRVERMHAVVFVEIRARNEENFFFFEFLPVIRCFGDVTVRFTGNFIGNK